MNLRLIALVSLLVGTLVGLLAWRWVGGALAEPPPDTVSMAAAVTTTTGPVPDPPPQTTITVPTRPGYVTTRSGSVLSAGPGEEGTAVAGAIVMPVLATLDGGYRVLDTCNTEGWVPGDDVEVGMVPAPPPVGDFAHAVFVIDPGHGLPDYGAVGPNGLTETEANLDVSARLADLLSGARDVDWETGEVRPGTSVPSALAILTRAPDGPNGGDYQLGLTFRAELANAVDATALVSVHHNTAPETSLDHPGTEAFVSADSDESARLGGLMVDELRRGFARFEADWTGSSGSGVITRVDPDGSDYYTVLEVADVPAAIVEGVYISNPSEEALAMTDAFRQAYADGMYRALVRFVTTDDHPIPTPDPVLWETNRPGPTMSSCQLPTP